MGILRRIDLLRLQRREPDNREEHWRSTFRAYDCQSSRLFHTVGSMKEKQEQRQISVF